MKSIDLLLARIRASRAASTSVAAVVFHNDNSAVQQSIRNCRQHFYIILFALAFLQNQPLHAGTPAVSPPPPQLVAPGTTAPSGATDATSSNEYGFLVNLSFALNCQIEITDLTTGAITYGPSASSFTTFSNYGY